MKIEAQNNGITKSKGKARSAVWFIAGGLVGVVLGGTTTYKVMAQPYQNFLADAYISQAMTDAQTATRLRQGQRAEVAKRIEMILPNQVLMINHDYKSHHMTPKALGYIRSYYEKNNIPIPRNIQPILGALPN